jgi:hypothetical protein
LLETVKNRVINWPSTLEVLYDDSLQQRRCDLRIPNAIRIHDDDRPIAADSEARSLSALHTPRAEEQILPLQELREERIELAAATVGRAEIARAHQHVTRILLHLRLPPLTHSAKIHMLTDSSTCTTVGSN